MKNKLVALFLIVLFSYSNFLNSNFLLVNGGQSTDFNPPSRIVVPVNIFLAGFDFSADELDYLRVQLPSNNSYTYLYGNEEKTRYFYYGNTRISVLLENNYSIRQISSDEWNTMQKSLINHAVNSSITVPVNGILKTFEGFYLPVIESVSILRPIITSSEKSNGVYNIVILKPTISPLNNSFYWYKGNRYRASLLGNYYDMRIGWSLNNASLFLDVGAYSWWLEENNHGELNLLHEAKNRNVSAVGVIVSNIVSYLVDNVPLSRVPIIPVKREMRISLLSIYNTSISRGSPYYLVGMDDLAKKTEELLPYFKTIPKYYGMYKITSLYPVSDILRRNIITFNNVTFLNVNSELIKSLYVFFKDYVLPDTEKNYFNVFVFFFDLDVPVYQIINGKLVKPSAYYSGMIFLDYYSVKNNDVYSDYQIRYSALRQIPPIFGIMSHTERSALVDFVQDPLSGYDMEKQQYISYSNFSRHAFARYFSILYNISLLHGLKNSHDYLEKYPFLKIDFSEIENQLSQANKLFQEGLLIKAAEKFFELWEHYSLIRGKLMNWIVGIKSTYFWGSVVLILLSIVIVVREKKIEKFLVKEINRLISKGKGNIP